MKVLLWFTLSLYGVSLGAVIASISGHRHSLERFSRYTLFVAFGLHTLVLGLRMLEVGHAPMMGRYETLLFFSWTVVLLNLILIARYQFRETELLTAPAVMLALVFAALTDASVIPLPLVLKTWWFEVHVVTSFFAYALFSLAAAAGSVYLYRARGPGQTTLVLLQNITYRATLWGFSFFSLSMLLGSIWAYLAWGSYWTWESKSTASLLLWFYFAGVLHTRFARQWRGRPAALLAVVGFALVLFTYLGVSVFLESSHRM